MVAYQTLIDGRDEETRADIDAAIAGAPLPSKIREREDANRKIRQMAEDGLVEIG